MMNGALKEVSNEDGWMSPEWLGDYVLSLDVAVDLLNEYSARAAANEQGNAAERSRDLLDALLSYRSAEV